MTDDIADRMFLFLAAAVQAQFGAGAAGDGFKSEHVEAAAIAGDFLDSCAPLPAAPSDEDVRKGWTIEDRSAYEHQKAQYGDLSPQEWLDRTIAMDEEKGTA